MGGIIVPILNVSEYNYSYLTGGTSRTIQLHRALLCAPFYYATLELRVHDHNLSSGQSVTLAGWGTNPSRADAQEFTELTTTLSISVTNASAAPYLKRSTISDVPSYLKILLTFTQGSSTGTAHYTRLSADLILREA